MRSEICEAGILYILAPMGGRVSGRATRFPGNADGRAVLGRTLRRASLPINRWLYTPGNGNQVTGSPENVPGNDDKDNPLEEHPVLNLG
jgi:hypothetical protein